MKISIIKDFFFPAEIETEVNYKAGEIVVWAALCLHNKLPWNSSELSHLI